MHTSDVLRGQNPLRSVEDAVVGSATAWTVSENCVGPWCFRLWNWGGFALDVSPG